MNSAQVRRAFRHRLIALTVALLAVLAAVTLAACGELTDIEATEFAVSRATRLAEGLATREARDALAAKAQVTREAQDVLIEVVDTALAEGEIDRGEFIDAVETIRAGGVATEGSSETSQPDTPSEPPPEPERLPPLEPDQPVVEEPPAVEEPDTISEPPLVEEPVAVKAKGYQSVGVFQSKDWGVGILDASLSGDAIPSGSGASGKTILGRIDVSFARKNVPDARAYEWAFTFSFGNPFGDQPPGKTITLRGRARAEGFGAAPEGMEAPTMFFVTDLPDENVTVEQVRGPIEIPIGANTPRTAIMEVTIRIPEGDLGDRFTMGWGITGCARPCEYFWTYEGQEE